MKSKFVKIIQQSFFILLFSCSASSQQEDFVLQQLGKVITKNFRDGNETSALLSNCKTLAESNDAGGQYCLATFYFYGAGGLEKDKQKWLELIRKSAEQDYPISVFYMGNEYENGLASKQNPALAIKWYLKAAELGHQLAMRRLAKIYKEGELGVAVDLMKFKYWNDRAPGVLDKITRVGLKRVKLLERGK